MEQPRIYALLEEIAKEIKIAEKKNLELYTSAIDVEDERLSLKIQTKSFNALRRMKGLKSAMDTFKSELEKSGLLKGDSDGVYISIEHGSIGVGEVSESKPETEPYTELKFEPEAHQTPETPETPQADENPQDGELSRDFNDFGDFEEFGLDNGFNEPETEMTAEIPKHIAEEIETMGNIIESLKHEEEVDDDFSDLLQLSPNEVSDTEPQQTFQQPQVPQLPQQQEEIGYNNYNDGNDNGEEEVLSSIEDALEAMREETPPPAPISTPEIPPENPKEETRFAPAPSVTPAAFKAPSPDAHEEDDFSGFAMSSADGGKYSNKMPVAFIVFGRRVDVRDWSDMLVKVCEILILKNPYTVAQFDKYNDLNPAGNCCFSYNRGDIRGTARKLSNGLWIELSRSHDDIVMLCKKLLELCGYPRSGIEIEFAD